MQFRSPLSIPFMILCKQRKQSKLLFAANFSRGNKLYPKITYTMMLFIGICISLTKNPMKPIMQKPMAVAIAIFWNSETQRNQ